MIAAISARQLKAALRDGQEIALLDPRPAEEVALGHILAAVNLPSNVSQQDLSRLVPRAGTRIVLCDGEGAAEGPARAAAARLAAWGYGDLSYLEGGLAAWQVAGFQLYGGTYSLNNVFALHVERQQGTVRITAQDLEVKIAAGKDLLILDTRTPEEFCDATVSHARSLPLAELPLRIKDLAPEETREIVVTCGGRARAVLGCQSLRDLGLKNPVSALYYGAAGWDLAGLPLENGRQDGVSPPSRAARSWGRAAAGQLSARSGLQFLDLDALDAWISESDRRSLYLIDVRSQAEFAAGHIPESRWVPGGELVGLTFDHIATRNSRLCLIDNDDGRAVLTAYWLRRMGWQQARPLAGGISTWQATGRDLAQNAPSQSEAASTADQHSDKQADQDSPEEIAARHESTRRTMESREKLLDRFDLDDSLVFDEGPFGETPNATNDPDPET
jgi:rhodanese-related sulfurtransferase